MKTLFLRVIVLSSLCFFKAHASAADKVLAIPIPQLSSSNQFAQMMEREMPASLDHFTPFIVGGTQAERDEFPEFAQLFVDGLDGFIYAICGATLLSSNKVLTAAHCVSEVTASRFYVLPNFYSFDDNISFSDLISVSAKNQHPNYEQSAEFNNDVAILTLSGNSDSPTAKIFASDEPLVGYSATIIGTGLTSEGGSSLSRTLRQVTVPIVSNAICKSSYNNSSITDSMLCAGQSSGGKDSCQGDSGGPLWVNYGGQKVQAGIVSWGFGCARRNFYGVYSRTSELIDFILKFAPDTRLVKGGFAAIPPIMQLLLLDSSSPAVPTPPVDSRLHCDNPRPDTCPQDGESDYLYYYSQENDYIGLGTTNLIRKSDTQTFELSENFDNEFIATVIKPAYAEWWYLSFASIGNTQLQVGTYTEAVRYPFQSITENGLNFYGNGRGCNRLSGKFEIFEVEYNSVNQPTKLAVNFEQHCEDGAPALFGYYRFNSNAPMHPN